MAQKDAPFGLQGYFSRSRIMRCHEEIFDKMVRKHHVSRWELPRYPCRHACAGRRAWDYQIGAQEGRQSHGELDRCTFTHTHDTFLEGELGTIRQVHKRVDSHGCCCCCARIHGTLINAHNPNYFSAHTIRTPHVNKPIDEHVVFFSNLLGSRCEDRPLPRKLSVSSWRCAV